MPPRDGPLESCNRRCNRCLAHAPGAHRRSTLRRNVLSDGGRVAMSGVDTGDRRARQKSRGGARRIRSRTRTPSPNCTVRARPGSGQPPSQEAPQAPPEEAPPPPRTSRDSPGAPAPPAIPVNPPPPSSAPPPARRRDDLRSRRRGGCCGGRASVRRRDRPRRWPDSRSKRSSSR